MTKVFGIVLAVSLSICPIGTYAADEETNAILDALRKAVDSHRRTVIDEMKSTVEAERTRLPEKSDDSVTLLNVYFREVPTVFYFYTLKATKEQLAARRKPVRQEVLIQTMCAELSATQFLDVGGVFAFHYLSNDGRIVFKFKVDRLDCLGIDQ